MTTKYQARPTVYRGIRMRSRTEAQFAVWLDSLVAAAPGCSWEYEPYAFGSPRGQYLPDFHLTLGPEIMPEPSSVYIEVKGIVTSPQDLLTIQTKMEIIWDSEPDCELWIMVRDGRVWGRDQEMPSWAFRPPPSELSEWTEGGW